MSKRLKHFEHIQCSLCYNYLHTVDGHSTLDPLVLELELLGVKLKTYRMMMMAAQLWIEKKEREFQIKVGGL